MKIRKLVLSLLLMATLLPAASQAADTYSRLLMSNAWCSVRPGPDGRRIRIVFHPDGHYVLTSDHRGNEGHWKVKGRTLYMGEGDTAPEPVASELRKVRRGGRFILFVDGDEFARCR